VIVSIRFQDLKITIIDGQVGSILFRFWYWQKD